MPRPIAWLLIVLCALFFSLTLFVSATGILPALLDEQHWRQVLAVRTEKAIIEYGERCGQCLHRATVMATLDKKAKDDGQVSRLQNRDLNQEDVFWEAWISADGRAVHSVSGGVLSSWAAESGVRLRKFSVAPMGNNDEDRRLTGKIAVAVAGQPSNARAAVLSETGAVSIWDVERKQLLERLPAKLAGKSMEASADRTWVGWWGPDEAMAWTPKRREPVRMAHPGLMALVFTGASEAITVSARELLRWDLDRGAIQSRRAFEAQGKYLGHDATGRSLYFSVQGQLTVQDAVTGAVRKTLDTRGKPMRMACSTGNERFLAAGSDDGTFLVWDQQSGTLLAEEPAHPVSLDLLRCAAASSRILTLGLNRREGRIWDLERLAGQVKRAQLGVPIEIVSTDQQWWLKGLVDRALDGQWLQKAPWLMDLMLGCEALMASLSAGGLFLLFYLAKGLKKYSKT